MVMYNRGVLFSLKEIVGELAIWPPYDQDMFGTSRGEEDLSISLMTIVMSYVCLFSCYQCI